MQVLLVCKPDTLVLLLAEDICQRLSKQGAVVTIIKYQDVASYDGQCEVVVVLGGDGTILKAARHFAGQGVPVMGVNFGTIGFLSSTEVDEALQSVDRLIRKEYHIEERLMLKVTVLRNTEVLYQAVALNDAVIRAEHCHTACIDIVVNDVLCNRFRGDGIICATPTGSTGYSLSAGGSVVDTSLAAIIVTPICTQMAFSRSLVLSDGCKISLHIKSTRETCLYLDGEEITSLRRGDEIMVERAQSNAGIIYFNTQKQLARLFRPDI